MVIYSKMLDRGPFVIPASEYGDTMSTSVTVDFYNRASKVGFERAGYVLKSKVFSWSVGGGRVRSRVKKS